MATHDNLDNKDDIETSGQVLTWSRINDVIKLLLVSGNDVISFHDILLHN